jgi:tetratricopeptide (TPR) repeat protein
MTSRIKHEERMGNLTAARSLLSRLRTQSIDKAWRTIMEGGLLEARAGNIVVARKIFKYLIKNVPWYGPIYQEAYRFEEKCEEYDRAIAIVEKGLKENPRYGPLWFSALRIHACPFTEGPYLTIFRLIREDWPRDVAKCS